MRVPDISCLVIVDKAQPIRKANAILFLNTISGDIFPVDEVLFAGYRFINNTHKELDFEIDHIPQTAT